LLPSGRLSLTEPARVIVLHLGFLVWRYHIHVPVRRDLRYEVFLSSRSAQISSFIHDLEDGGGRVLTTTGNWLVFDVNRIGAVLIPQQLESIKLTVFRAVRLIAQEIRAAWIRRNDRTGV
jgi:hypothetical protein